MPVLPKIEGLDQHQVASLAYCRTYKQYLAMIEGYNTGKCPFCDPLDPEKNRIIQAAEGWRMWVNPFALAHTELHLVMAPMRHVAPGDRIIPQDFSAMGALFHWAQLEFGFTGGGFAMRFGSPLQSSGTVLHLHANIIIPDQSGSVEVTLAKDPAKIAHQVARMFVFEKLRTGTVSHDSLSPDEQKLVDGCL